MSTILTSIILSTSNDLPFLNWDGYESNCGYVYQNGGYIYQQAVNDGEPCASLVQEACDEACTWNSDIEICELGYVCENDNGVALLGWDRESISAENDCNSASICINNSGHSLEGWNFSSNTQAECEDYSVCLDNNGSMNVVRLSDVFFSFHAFIITWITVFQIYYYNNDVQTGVLAILSYGLVVWSMQYIEIAYVSSIRESSIIFATAIGFLILKEKQAKNRLIPSCLIVLGIAILFFQI